MYAHSKKLNRVTGYNRARKSPSLPHHEPLLSRVALAASLCVAFKEYGCVYVRLTFTNGCILHIIVRLAFSVRNIT